MSIQAVGYIRVTPSSYLEGDVNLETQKTAIEEWCQRHGYELLNVHIDAASDKPKTGERPALQKALNECWENRVLVVYSLPRLARSTKETIEIAERLQTRNCDLVSILEKIDTTTAAGQMVFRFLTVLSEIERQ